MAIQINGSTGISGVNGTGTNPVYSGGDSDTGIFFPALGQVAITTNGVQRLLITETGDIQSASVLSFPGGSASAPSIAFTGDTDTGLYSPSANSVAISTSGSGRLFVDASGRVGIGTSGPGFPLEVRATSSTGQVQILGSDNTNATWRLATPSNSVVAFGGAPAHAIAFGGFDNTTQAFSERARIDSSGRLLVGTSSASVFTYGGITPRLQVEGTDGNTGALSIARNSNDANAPGLIISKSRGTTAGSNTIVQNNDTVGDLRFEAADGTQKAIAASIACMVDGTPGANDMPGRLVFSTTADGASFPTERLRITSAGLVGIGTSSPGAPLDVVTGSSGAIFRFSTASTNLQIIPEAANGNVGIRFAANSGAAPNLQFRNDAGSNLVTITNGGNVGIGTTSPTSLLHLSTSALADLRFTDPGEATDQKNWSWQTGTGIGAGTFRLRAINDANSTGENAYIVTRSGASVQTHQWLTAGSERLRITSAGLVGIGTSSPGRNLHVAGSSATALIESTGSTNADLLIGDGGVRYYGIRGVAGGGSLQIRNDTANTTLATFTSTGLVGIGTTTPQTTLDCNGNIRVPNNTFYQSSDGSGGWVELIKADSSNNTAIANNKNLAITFATGGAVAERARIDSSGRLLVGTSSYSDDGTMVARGSSAGAATQSFLVLQRGQTNPAPDLDLGVIRFTDATGSLGAQIAAQSDGGFSWGTNDYPTRLVFSTTADGASSPTERMRLDSTGRLFLNTTASPSTSSFGTAIGTVLAHSRDTSTGAVAQIYGNAGEFRIIGSGNAQNTNNSYGAISDQSLKTDISDAGSQWDDIKGITVRKFKLIGTDTLQIGVVAQECELVSPGLVEDTVLEQEDGTTSTVKAVKYSVLYMKAVKALQEAMERIEQLEQRLADAGI